MIYEDKTRPISWTKAFLIALSMTVIAYLISAFRVGTLILDQLYIYVGCLVFVTLFLRRKSTARNRQSYVQLYEDYLICKGQYTSLKKGKKPDISSENLKINYDEITFIIRNQVNIIFDIEDIRITLFSLSNAVETEKIMKNKALEKGAQLQK